MGKFKHDLDDYNLNRVFSWNKKNIPYTPPSTLSPYPSSHSRQVPVLPCHPPIPFMSIRLPNNRILTSHQRNNSHSHVHHPLPHHPQRNYTTSRPYPNNNTHTNNNNKKDELIRALHQFYNRPLGSSSTVRPTSPAPGPSVSATLTDVP